MVFTLIMTLQLVHVQQTRMFVATVLRFFVLPVTKGLHDFDPKLLSEFKQLV